ncbi:hypothetical protein [Mesorhizobium sp. CAU 1741]|uniref:hypothetical protein n=1 Tax=Mesorhizobium sp. CAU 1741 TaxID=3140366 RepID=UPI00325BE3C8
MDRAAEAKRLNSIRRRVDGLAGMQWLLSADGNGMQMDARGGDGSLVTFLRFTGKASPEEVDTVSNALDDARFLLGLLDRAMRALRPAQPPRETAQASKDHTTEAAMLCSDPAFKRFLMERHGLESPATDERTAQRQRSLLGVTSRKEINQSDVARERWLALRGEFHAWKRGG